MEREEAMKRHARSLRPGAAILLALLASGFGIPGRRDVREATYANGSLKERYEVVTDETGQTVRHGKYEAWFESGEVAVVGAYENGRKTGAWQVRYENGKREAQGRWEDDRQEGRWKLFHENGRKHAEGTFRAGYRDGKWSFWDEAGRVDSERSGRYRFERQEGTADALAAEGCRMGGLAEGLWRYFWENGVEAWSGEYRSGIRTGPWRFHHPDGTYDPEMLSGIYEDGVRVSAIGDGEPLVVVIKDLSDLPAVAHPEGWTDAAQEELDGLLDAIRFQHGTERHETLQAIASRRAQVMPTLLCGQAIS